MHSHNIDAEQETSPLLSVVKHRLRLLLVPISMQGNSNEVRMLWQSGSTGKMAFSIYVGRPPTPALNTSCYTAAHHAQSLPSDWICEGRRCRYILRSFSKEACWISSHPCSFPQRGPHKKRHEPLLLLFCKSGMHIALWVLLRIALCGPLFDRCGCNLVKRNTQIF